MGKKSATRATGESRASRSPHGEDTPRSGRPTRAQLAVALQAAREQSQANLEEWATANEELRCANEDLSRLNEQLAATGAELHASNDELGQVNAVLQGKVAELDAARDDMENLLNATRVAAIFVDRALRVTRVTPAAGDVFGLRAEAVGQPISAMAPLLDGLGVADLAQATLAELSVGEREFVAADGSWFQLRVIPYRTLDGAIAGVVLTFVDLTARRAAEQEVAEMNRTLEARVVERTRALAESMQELESFSYSVSHDLRAPLRAIDGFSRVLSDEYGPQLGDEGRHCLTRIRTGATRMGELIDDLLALAHVARVELHRVPVSLTGVANEVVTELRQNDPARMVCVTVAEGLRADADPPLLRAVLGNLLGNAWKFTRRVGGAAVEVGSCTTPLGPTYYVRDNGVGFDMRYADKLFVPFQRLHDASDFEGSGIGLATVRRIVSRHGGAVWAEGAVDSGATFYFTLPVGR
jgi:PAS domain S-box-containing protein